MKRMLSLLAASCAFAAMAEVVTVSNNTARVAVKVTSAHNNISPVSLTAETEVCRSYPSEVGTPIFWFDASETNGWEFAEGTLDVVKIPSKVGSRYLSINDNGGSWTKDLWSRWWQQKSPRLVTNVARINGHNAVDFGAQGSDMGLLFDPISNEATGFVASNILHNIGTVITVYDSENGGGYFMGGGFGPIDNGTWNGGYQWLRGDVSFVSKNQKKYTHLNCVGRGSTPSAFNQGTVRRNLGSSHVQYMGFGGCWEVVTMNPTNAVMQATGLGLNDGRHNPNSSNLSGGMKIAEMLIFGKILSPAECAKVEKWLMERYLDKMPGVNGNASLGSIYAYRNDWLNKGYSIDVDVPAGETLTISKNQHGYGGCFDASNQNPSNLSAFVKTGAGTLALADAVNYQGVVRLNEGRLTVPKREVPAALPDGAYLHFDASDAASMATVTEGGDEYLTLWRNLTTTSTFYDEAICARPPAAHNRPTVIRDALGAGLNVIDFSTNAVDGAFLSLATNETVETWGRVSIPRFVTMVAVFGAQMGGGHIVGHKDNNIPLRRDVGSPTSFRADGFANNVEGTAAYCDGIPVGTADTFQNAGYQVFALRTTGTRGSDIEFIGRSRNYTGGLRLAELAVYHSALTDTELRDASAYLMRKWLNRTAPGYRRPDSDVADIQNIVAGGGEFYVPAGETVTVARVSGAIPLVKTGEGVLKVQELDTNTTVMISVNEGKAISAAKPDVASACEIAAEPSLHLRADNAKAIALIPGTEKIAAWCDDGWANAAYLALVAGNNVHYPSLVTSGGPNGKPFVDFGTIGSSGKCLHLSRALNSMRSAYVVCKLNENPSDVTGNWPMPLGSTGGSPGSGQETGGTMCNFLRQDGQIIGGNGVTTMARDGIYTNGVKVAYTIKPLTGVWMLLEFHMPCGAHLSTIGDDRGQAKGYGGFELGELVAFERPLSEREKIATRNYLMKKWLGTADEDLQELPDAPTAPDALGLSVLEVDGEAAVDVAASQAVTRITGAGTLEKTGAGTLTVNDWSALSGTVLLSGGTLALTKASPTSQGALVTDGLLFHADASQGVSTVTNVDGTISVTSWQSTSDPSWTAAPKTGWKSPSYCPAEELNGGRAVDMAQGVNQGLVFKKDGEMTLLEGVRSAIWFIGSQNGGGFLLGGGKGKTIDDEYGYAFHRGGNAGIGAASAGDTLLNTAHACASAVNAAWRKNGTNVRPGSVGLSGGWDILSMNVTNDNDAAINVYGFAFDGRVLAGYTSFNGRIGSQRLAEVALYDRQLSDSEIVSMETYLKAKWCLGWQAAPATNLAVEIAAGATLDCSAGAQVVGSLSGAGTVSGDISSIGLVADGTAVAWPTVTGTFTMPANMTVELRNTTALPRPLFVKMLSVGSVEGNPKETIVTTVGDDNGDREMRVVFRDGALWLRERTVAFRVIIR